MTISLCTSKLRLNLTVWNATRSPRPALIHIGLLMTLSAVAAAPSSGLRNAAFSLEVSPQQLALRSGVWTARAFFPPLLLSSYQYFIARWERINHFLSPLVRKAARVKHIKRNRKKKGRCFLVLSQNVKTPGKHQVKASWT